MILIFGKEDEMIGIIWLIPIIIGAIVVFAKPKPVVSWTNKLNDWIIEKRKKFAENEDTLSKYFFRPLLGGLYKIMEWTGKRFEDEFLRSGVRITLILYFIMVMAFVAYIVIVVIIAIIILVLLFWIITRILFGKEEEEVTYASRYPDTRANPIFNAYKIEKAILSEDKIFIDKSGRRLGTLSKDLFSEDQIIKDASGNTVGRIAQSLWDKDVQVIKDSEGNKIGEIKNDLFGNRVIVDDEGDKVGTIKKNILGETVIEKD